MGPVRLSKILEKLAYIAVGAMVATICFPHEARGHEIGLNTISLHAKGGYEWNTPGLYVVADQTFAGLNTAGYVRNSLKRHSFYAGRTWSHGRFALSAGGITGYRYAVSPYLVPSVKIGSVRLMWLEPPEPKSSRALHVALTF